jgi:hypothetical protein
MAAVIAQVRGIGEGGPDGGAEGGPEAFAARPLVDEEHVFGGGDRLHGAGPAADGVTVGAAFHGGDEDGRGAAAAGLGDEDAQVGVEGGAGFGVGLRPLWLRVVVTELEEKEVAEFKLAEDFVEAVTGDETFGGFSALGGVGEGEGGLEELRELGGPVAAGAATGIGDGGVAGEKDGGEGIVFDDDEGDEGGARGGGGD